MQHSPLPSGIDRDAFIRWGNGLMRMTNNFDLARPFGGVCSPSNVNYAQEDTGCAIGYAPFFEVGNPNIYTLEDSQRCLNATTMERGGWNEYSLSIVCGNQNLGHWIGSSCWGATDEEISKITYYPFNFGCKAIDNTAIGAGQRILYAIENGVPDIQSMVKMWRGEIPLPYIFISSDITFDFDVNDYENYTDLAKKEKVELIYA